MTTNQNTLSKLFMSSVALIALFAALGAALLFTSNVSAQTVDDGATTTEQPRQRRGRGGSVDAATLAEAVANGDITQERADEITAQQAERTAQKELMSSIFDKDATHAAIATALGVTIEELEAAKEAHTVDELLEAAGMTKEDMKAIVEAEKAAQLAAAVANGTITQEQADELSEQSGRHGKRGGGKGRPARNGVPAAEVEA